MSRFAGHSQVLSEFDLLPAVRLTSGDAKLSSSSSEDSLPPDGMEEAASLPYYGTLPYDCTPIVPGPTARHAAWPPLIMRTEKLGYIVDSEWCHSSVPSLKYRWRVSIQTMISAKICVKIGWDSDVLRTISKVFSIKLVARLMWRQ